MYTLPRFKLYNSTKMGWHKYLRIHLGQMKADDKHTANGNLKPSLLRFWGFENSDAGLGVLGKLGVSATISGFAHASSLKAGPPVSVQKRSPLTLQRYSVAESAPDHVRSCRETARSTTSRLHPWDPYVAPRAGLQSTVRLIKLPSWLKTQEVVFSTCSVGDPCLPGPGVLRGERRAWDNRGRLSAWCPHWRAWTSRGESRPSRSRTSSLTQPQATRALTAGFWEGRQRQASKPTRALTENVLVFLV